MRSARRGTAFAILALSCLAGDPSHAADPVPAGTAEPAPAGSGGLAVSGPGREVMLAGAALNALPFVQVTVPAGAAPGARSHSFEGPLLWTVLAQAGAVDPAKFHGDVRSTVVLTGQDGYTAVLALGELSPEFENKQVILALRADGQPLEPGHPRVVVPGDKRGGRGVHDLVRINVAAGPASHHGAQ